MNIVCVINGSTTVRERSSEEITVLDCGCAHTRGEIQRWVQMCRTCYNPWYAWHHAAQEAHRAHA